MKQGRIAGSFALLDHAGIVNLRNIKDDEPLDVRGVFSELFIDTG
jgi:hypothetical protein